MKLLLVVNPISGGVDKEPFLRDAKALLDKHCIEHYIFKTTGKDDEIELKKVIDTFQPDKVASIGGDGTTLFTGTALIGSDIPMGIIALGSANGMAVELNVNPTPIYAFTDLILSNHIKGLDIILINDEYYCLHIGDVGINAQIVDKYSKDSKRGMLTYAKYYAKEVLAHHYFEYTIDANGKEYSGKTLDMNFCNARKFGSGMPLTKDGSPFDGKFEIVLIDDITRSKLLRAGLSIIDDRYINESSHQVIKCEEATIRFKEKQLLQLDGEIIGKLDTINAKIQKGAIKFISHKGNNKAPYFPNVGY